MACPYFEPLHLASPVSHPNARLPLIEEYDGLCHATPLPFAPAVDHRFNLCNQGNVQPACPHFPLSDSATSLRYQILTIDKCSLEILMVEEKRHWPLAWNRVHFQIATGDIQPPVSNLIVKAQLLAFCTSYLKRFPEPNEPG